LDSDHRLSVSASGISNTSTPGHSRAAVSSTISRRMPSATTATIVPVASTARPYQ
jgi:hypothetical protein